MSTILAILFAIIGLYALRAIYRALVHWSWQYGGGGYDEYLFEPEDNEEEL